MPPRRKIPQLSPEAVPPPARRLRRKSPRLSPAAEAQTSQLTTPGDRRGLFSCLYSGECDEPPDFCLKFDLMETIPDYYEEAIDRLPVEDMPADAADQLMTSMGRSALSLGLLDPASNIILNTIALLRRDFPDPPLHCRRRSSRLARPSRHTTLSRRDTWARVAGASYLALRSFMVSYFGCLSEEQATRYLHWARGDLVRAVLLVEHDLYDAELQIPNPASQRTQAALKCAAIYVSHPAPDVLVRLQASPLPQQWLDAAAPFLKPQGRKLTLDDVELIVRMLRHQHGAPLDLQVKLLPDSGELTVYYRNFNPDEAQISTHNTNSVNHGGNFSLVTYKVERHGDRLASLSPQSPRGRRSMISSCLEDAEKAYRTGGLVESCCGDACEYTESLRMRLHSTIHAFYLKVFTMLPRSMRLIRDILFAGHCYGPMDPVSNIIVNSIWHSIVYPLPLTEIEEYHIIDALSMLRVEVRSLEGLIALVRGNSDSGCSTQQVMEHLSLKCCDLSQGTHTLQQFPAAAAAARHPQHAALGSFLASLTPNVLYDLRRLLTTGTNGVISPESLGQIEQFLRYKAVTLDPEPRKVSELCEEAKVTLQRMKSYYDSMSLYLCSKLEQLLQKYASEHPLEPKYVLTVICGMVAGSESLDRECYHVNFVAASKSRTAGNKLFFAELNWSCPGEQAKPDFCCPLPLIHTGRCYYGKGTARKIVYPDSVDFLECDHDITPDGTEHTDGMLDVDLMFDFRSDAQFADDMREYCEHQKKLLQEGDEY
ncbi:hypothetical protein CFC21_090444 [Triticum aestivum]|uniref:Uncharacterized protein n=2 Tax=Triticum aestivum TaxID=4565 RepID=A0A3B6MJM8_WHEAT|nr:uncharacterized protein LOC123119103 [Triticum aestivum]KAF7087246.1 hypothetical protein CFC21_090444 [Triticum aestivum]